MARNAKFSQLAMTAGLVAVVAWSLLGGSAAAEKAVKLPEPAMDMLSYVFSSFLLDGAVTALKISAFAMIGGVLLGLMLALMRLSTLAPVRDGGRPS